MTGRWLLPLLLVAVFLIGAAGALVVERGTFRSPTPTPTTLPTSTATSQPTSTVTVVYITATPRPSVTSSAHTTATTSSPHTTATTSSSNAVTTDQATIRAHGYTPHGNGASTPDGAGGTLYAWQAVCSGSADGYCQKVFFFVDARYLGTDTSHASSAISAVQAAGPSDINVTYPSYAANDPLCCPSGKPVTITYHWTGTKLVPSGTPPGH